MPTVSGGPLRAQISEGMGGRPPKTVSRWVIAWVVCVILYAS